MVKHKIVLEIEDMPEPSKAQGNVTIKFEITPEFKGVQTPALALFHRVMAALRDTQVAGPGTPTKKQRAKAKINKLLGKSK